nr:Predicted cell-wall-anchored protein SasA (LPXTG motif) [Kibdelosporangium sp. MJ126-NF4]CTQ96012.1 Predicted cell-wall-anchored protein SasA (LPXTG motif) [Kibdelosporangium sp. MJ126-NF4]
MPVNATKEPESVSSGTVTFGPGNAAIGRVVAQREDPPTTRPTNAPAGPGDQEGKQVGTWGVHARTALKAKKREERDFDNKEAAVAYARGLEEAACVFEEKSRFLVYQLDYSWLSGFSSFTYSGTRMTRNSPISDVKGVPGVLAFVTEDGVPILPHQFGDEASYKDWMDQQDTLKPGENPFDAHKEAFGAGLGKISGQDKFEHQFELAMRDTALSTLDKSQAEATKKKADIAAGADKAKIDDVANRLATKDKELNEWQTKLDYHETPGFIFQGDDIKKCKEQVDKLTGERRLLLLEYPLLSQIPEPNGKSTRIPSAEFAALPADQKGARLGDITGQVLENITATRTNVISGELKLWIHQPLVDSTLAGLGITDQERTGWVRQKVAREKAAEQVDKTFMMILQIGLTALASAFSGGALGAAFAAGAGIVTVADAVNSSDALAAKQAAANTDVNKEQALIPADIDGEWGVLVVVWVGAGLSFLEAVNAVRLIKAETKTLDAARAAGGSLEKHVPDIAKQAGKDEALLMKLAGSAGKVAPTEHALRETLLSALPSELRPRFANVPVTITPEKEFLAKYGSHSGEAVTTFTKGANGELVPAVAFKEGANPLVMREEAVHLAQSADPAMAGKLGELSETAMGGWKTLDSGKQLSLYRTKIEVEIDAQRRLMAQYAGGDPRYLEQVKATLSNLEERLKEVDSALANPAVFEKSKPAWWDENQPPRLFGKRGPNEWNGEWSGKPGHSQWIEDTRPEVLKYTKGEGIPFRDWCPNLKQWSVIEVDIDMSLTNHFGQADLAAAEQMAKINPAEYLYQGRPNAAAVERWREANGYTWHHMKGGKQMQLVPTELHSKIAHEGGASEARAAAGH